MPMRGEIRLSHKPEFHQEGAWRCRTKESLGFLNDPDLIAVLTFVLVGLVAAVSSMTLLPLSEEASNLLAQFL